MAQMNKIGSHATSVSVDHEGFTYIRYHDTIVTRFNKEVIELDNGGYLTSTTKTRMNQASNQFDLGYQVYQKDYEWFVDYNGETIPFIEEKVILYRK